MLFTRLILRIVLLSSICISSTVFGLPLVEVNPNSGPGHAVPKCQFASQTRYPPPSPLDLIPLYFFTCAVLPTQKSSPKGPAWKVKRRKYGTKFKFPLSKDVTPSMNKETQTVSHVRREELVRKVLRFLLYDVKGRIPEESKPDRCLNGAFVVVKFNLNFRNLELHSPEDIDTVSDNREAIVTTFEKDGSTGTAVVLRGKIAASPPTLMVDSYCTGNTPEEAWSSMGEQRGNRVSKSVHKL
ncbi:hypothetical protein C8R42DRAFT_715221 [Lentinula raphanica]|nr:hypothetical protein C8R42DRAFT_715221 [Lentinula raphanica]